MREGMNASNERSGDYIEILLIFLSLNNKNQEVFPSQSRFGACCLTILIYTFKCFKGATNPCHTYVSGFLNVGLWYERCRFMV